MKKIITAGLMTMALMLTACGSTKNEIKENKTVEKEDEADKLPFFSEVEKDDIVVLFTTDVHHKLTDYIGYDGYVFIKNKLEEKITNDNVISVDCGDCLNGGELGENTNGMGIAEIMEYVGMDVCVPGNNDFEYGVNSVKEISDKLDFEYVCCNLREKATNELVLKPYTIIEKSGKKIGIVGITTPNGTHYYEGCTDFAIVDEMNEENNTPGLYDFSEENFFERVQNAVDSVREEGADYVIAITHLGKNGEDFGSVKMINNTTGIDAVIDGHEHIEIEMEKHKNANGEEVLLTAAGEYMAYVGKLVIDSNGVMKSSLLHVSEFNEKDEETTKYLLEK